MQENDNKSIFRDTIQRKYWICPDCETENDPEAKRCAACGAPKTEIKPAEQGGTALFTSGNDRPPAPGPNPQTAPRRGLGTVGKCLLALGVLALVIVLLIALGLGRTAAPEPEAQPDTDQSNTDQIDSNLAEQPVAVVNEDAPLVRITQWGWGAETFESLDWVTTELEPGVFRLSMSYLANDAVTWASAHT